MGIQNNLAQANKDLAEVQKLVEKKPAPDLKGAQTAIGKVKTLIADSARFAEARYKRIETDIKQLGTFLNEVAKQEPFDAGKAKEVFKKAEAAIIAAEQAVKQT